MAAPIAYFVVPLIAVLFYCLLVPKQISVNRAVFMENVQPMDVFNVMKDVHAYGKIDRKILETSVREENRLDDGSRHIHASIIKHNELFGEVGVSTEITLIPSELQIKFVSTAQIFKVLSISSNGTLTFLTASRRKVPGTHFSMKMDMELPFILATLSGEMMEQEWQDFMTGAEEYCLDRLRPTSKAS